MADPIIDTQFTTGTVITSVWLNGINDFVNGAANQSDYTKGAALIGFDGNTLADQFRNRVNRVVNSIASLKTLDKTKYTRAFVTGYYTAGDGGGGAYWYDSTDTTSADNGGTIIVAADGARWKLVVTNFISVKQFGAKGDGVSDDTTILQAAITALSSFKTLTFPDGNYITTNTLTVSAANVTLQMSNNTTITYTVPSFIALNVQATATSFTLTGGTWVGPAVWDGTNVTPTYAVILCNADKATVSTKLSNIRKVGIWFKDANDCVANNCYLEGNYPSGQWTGVETVHYGILTDPNAGSNGGNFRISNNTIKSCVQGILAGNYGTGGVVRGVVITGNIFENCWNHGIYSNYTNGAVIVGNNFNRCQIPVVASGANNLVANNTLFTATNTVGDQRDLVGISIRDPQNCIIANNSIKGVVDSSNAVVINLQYFAVVVAPLTDNIITGNSINITAGVATPIRIEGTSGFGSTNVSHNIVSNNVIRASVGVDGAILIDGISTGVNSGNKVFGNNITIIGSNGSVGTDGVHMVNQYAGDVYDNAVSYEWSAGSAQTCYSVLFINTCQRCRSSGNASIVDFNWGNNLNIIGTAEIGSTPAGNFCYNNYNKVQTPFSATYTPIQTLGGTLMDVQESGNGVPGFAARVGSIWRRLDGGAGATLYVKETGTGSSGWVGK